jgi:Glycosyltransferase family 87
MRRAARENALCAFVAGVGCATMAWLGLYGFAWNDYDNEARPAFDALVHGHVLNFLRLAPAYGGSLIERAPFALVPDLWGGGQLAVYRMVTLPCLLAASVLGVWLISRMRADGRSTLARAVTLGLCVANPLTLRALELGHPEELLGACMCVAAVLLAARDRPLWAGLVLGLAVANKEWALLAAGPVLLALPAGRRLPCLASAGAVAAAVLAPLALAGSGGFAAATRGTAAPSGAIFQPWQAWWFFGHHGALVHGLFGAPKPGYRIGPAWAGTLSHPLILGVALILTAALWLQSSRPLRSRAGGRAGARALSESNALLALSLLLLLRCVLDTWDNVYYPLPFVFALLAWEVRSPARRPPVLALSSVALAWISFQWLPGRVSPDSQAAFFLAWSLPLAAVLGWWSYRGSVRRPTTSARATFTSGSPAVSRPSGALLATAGRMQSAGDDGARLR